MHYSKEEKRKLLEKWRKSGISAWAFAREKGLCQQTFLKWKKQESKVTSAGFVEVEMAKPYGAETNIIIEKGDIRIRLPLELDVNALAKVIQAARIAQ